MNNSIQGIKGFVAVPLMLRVVTSVDLPNGLEGCWIWRKPNPNGYGSIWANGKHIPSHRAVWEHSNGAVPKGLELDHVCKNKACCNPLHLETVTHSENNKRGWADKRKTHCKRGHQFTPENTILTPNGAQHCRTCQTMTNTAWNKKHRSAQARAALAKAVQS